MSLPLVLALLAAPPAGVTVELFDGLPAVNKWPPTPLPPAAETYPETAFGFARLPWRYTANGARADRGVIVLLRATADVTLPAGEYRALVRSRTAARLTVAGRVAAELPFPKTPGDGQDPVRRDALTLGLTRQVAPGDRETVVPFVTPGGPVRVVFEVMVGGVRNKEALRPELGESLAAVAPHGSNDFRLLGPGEMTPLTDAGWASYTRDRDHRLTRLETDRRAAAREKQADYWAKRRAVTAVRLAANPGPAVPAPSRTLPANNPVDHFLNAVLEPALAAKPPVAGDFHRDVKPLLVAKCGSCHGGEKARGGLRLDAPAALAGGDSGEKLTDSLPARVTSADPDVVMPPKGDRLTAAEVAALRAWVNGGAAWPKDAPFVVAAVPPLADDAAFLRRVYLDCVGTVPTAAEARTFLRDADPDKRAKLIDRLLADPRWADAWVPYWQDVLAENPNIVNPTLNNSGPFRYWLRDVLADNLPWDVAVTDLVMLEGSPYGGGPAGFGLAAENDAPFAAKAAVLAGAFLGVEMKCARCHDAPHHRGTQADLFALAGMLDRKPAVVPAGSVVPAGKLSRKPLVQVSLKPGEQVPANWPLSYLTMEGAALPPGRDADPRAKLAALVTGPANERFAQVMANRVWRRFLGRGLVEPPHDWEKATPSHPALLVWLGREFVRSGYDLKHLSRLVLTSRAYQRQASADSELVRAGAAPARRRVPPEALCDSLFDAAGRDYGFVGDVTFDPDGGRPWKMGGDFRTPRRAWQMPYLSNDRDRPSLSLPKAQAVTDLLTAFGWDGNRQFPTTDRTIDPAVGQSAVLANGAAAGWLARLSDDAGVTADCLSAASPEALAETLFLRVRSRFPTAAEKVAFAAALAPGFADRVRPGSDTPPPPLPRQPYASWVNHHRDEALLVRQAEAEEARRGPPPTGRLASAWRERAEDCLWALFNSPELVLVP